MSLLCCSVSSYLPHRAVASPLVRDEKPNCKRSLPPMVFLPLSCLALILCVSVPPAAFSLNEEGIALLSFKQSIEDDPEASLSNWDSSHADPCSWNGVTCEDFKVTSLKLPDKGLSGFLPSVLGSLSGLKHINLRTNKLHGSLPSEIFDAQSVVTSVAGEASSDGSVQTDAGKLRNLETLDLAENFFTGSVPTPVLQCRRLKTLVLSHNNFTGRLPEGFGTSLVSLEELDLSYNQFSGSIPVDFGNLSSLQGTVDLSNNRFSGSIPASLGNLPEKVYIDLTYNNLSGPIPQNGALANRGPTAFVGNPGLCGPPLKNPCYSDHIAGIPFTVPYKPPKNQLPSMSDATVVSSPSKGRRGLSRKAVVAIVVGDILGIGLIALGFLFCYWRSVRSSTKVEVGGLEKGQKGLREFLCFDRDAADAVSSENVEQHKLVPLDSEVGFDLEELLKSPAFVIGKTGIGIVYKVMLSDGRTLAVRRLGGGGLQRFREFQMEVELIGKIRHPNILTLRAYHWSPNDKLLVYDYISNGNLAAAIHGKAGMASFSPMPWLVRLKIMKGIARGLAYLHEFSPRKFVHGDLSPTNVLLGLDMEPYISNFGLGRLASIAGDSSVLPSDGGTVEQPNQPSEVSMKSPTKPGFYYQAPEAVKPLRPSQKWDVYSFGMILLELISGRSPSALSGTSDMDLARWVQVCIEENKPLSEVLDKFLVQEADKEEEMLSVLKIALACAQNNPERRPTMRLVSDSLDRFSTDTQGGSKDASSLKLKSTA
ncbi:hypothetical protein ACLOJK_033085 [Asimina triloba]